MDEAFSPGVTWNSVPTWYIRKISNAVCRWVAAWPKAQRVIWFFKQWKERGTYCCLLSCPAGFEKPVPFEPELEAVESSCNFWLRSTPDWRWALWQWPEEAVGQLRALWVATEAIPNTCHSECLPFTAHYPGASERVTKSIRNIARKLHVKTKWLPLPR